MEIGSGLCNLREFTDDEPLEDAVTNDPVTVSNGVEEKDIDPRGTRVHSR